MSTPTRLPSGAASPDSAAAKIAALQRNAGTTPHQPGTGLTEANRDDGEAVLASRRSRRGGPRTAEGKVVSARNATRAGISSASPVAGGEDVEDWEQFHREIHAALAPVGAAECAEVDQIAASYWRKRRVIRAEACAINRRAQRPPDLKPASTDEHILDELGCDLEMGVTVLAALVEYGERSTIDGSELVHALQLVITLGTTNPLPSSLTFPGSGEVWTAERTRVWLADLAELVGTTPDQMVTSALEKSRQLRRDRLERAATQSARLGASVFGYNTPLDTILRFDAHLDRTLDRALRRLEILQRARNGDLPAPERIEVTVTPP